ncbi:MAG: Hpt domain-containing protein [Planctomycetota bacterium]|jgi:HPt (histidine-containing phosphotransfer) domain-containing protein|nr:Hpt domain-containing protein [Planctomycetota bacterium]
MSELFDLALMREMATECGWSFAEFVDVYLRDAHAEIKKLKAAASPEEAARVAHGLAGSSATAGVTSIVSILREIENGSGDIRAAEERLQAVEAALRALPP